MKKSIGFLTIILLLAACARGPAPKGSPTLDTQAASIAVNTFADESDFIGNGKCSLREAIISANNNANYGGCVAGGAYTTTAPDIITLLTGTYTLNRGFFVGLSEQDWGDLDITSNMNIVGAGATSTTIQASFVFDDNEARVMQINGTVTMEKVAITGGNSTDYGGGILNNGTLTISNSTINGNIALFGGGIGNKGTLTISNSTISGNSARLSGGGIVNSTNSSTITISNSTISGNSTDTGGGGIANGGTLTISNSTISGNTATKLGGGVYQGNTGAVSTLTNTTISANIATNRGGGIRIDSGIMNLKNVTITKNTGVTAQGGVAVAAGTTNLINTIVAGNVSIAQPDCAGTFVSGGNNLIGISNCTGFGTATNDQVGIATTPINPQLGVLANNGGTTQTHALLAGSTAIDRGKATDCPTTDQHNTTRPRDGDNNGSLVCDIGAFELVNAAQADTNVTLTSPTQVLIGTNFNYVLTLSNLGPANATNMAVSLTMPAGVSFVSANNPNCISNAQVVDCTGLGNLANGASLAIQVTAKAPSTTGTLTATAKSSSATTDPVSTNNTVNRNTTFVAPPNLAMALTASASTVVTGSNFTYTLTVSNVGSGAASSAVVSFPLPSNVSFVSATSGCTASGATVTCTYGAINAGVSLSRTVTVLANTAGTASATASITSSVPADSNSSNNSASVNVTIVSPADLVMDVSASKTAVLTDEQFSYTVTISNNGPGTATAATISLTLPSQVSSVSADSGCTRAGAVVTCTLGTINSGSSLSRNVTVRANTAGATTATANITSSTPVDPNSTNNSDTVSVTINTPIADLALNMSAPTTDIPIGSSFSYTLVVTNHGPDASNIVNILQTLPANVIFQSSVDCVNIIDSNVSCGIETLASGASVSMVVNVLAITTGSNISSSADVGSLMSSDPISGNNISSATVNIIPSADIQAVIALPAQNSVHLPDSDVTYTVRARNTIGPSNAENVVLTVTFPSSFTNIRPPTGCTLSGRVVTCNFSSVAFGATVTKLITIHTPTVATTNLRTLAQVSLSTFDPNTTNNRMVRIISVQ